MGGNSMRFGPCLRKQQKRITRDLGLHAKNTKKGFKELPKEAGKSCKKVFSWWLYPTIGKCTAKKYYFNRKTRCAAKNRRENSFSISKSWTILKKNLIEMNVLFSYMFLYMLHMFPNRKVVNFCLQNFVFIELKKIGYIWFFL